MSIADELRKYAKMQAYPHNDRLRAIADRIDAEYQKVIWELNDLVDTSVLLPVDADGVPIHVGDVLDANRGTVTCIRDAGYGWEIVTDHAHCYNPADLRHYHETVKDVMVEFATDWESAQDGEDKEAVLKEYAARLRLADDGKEQ